MYRPTAPWMIRDDPPERIHQGRVNAKHVKPWIQIADFQDFQVQRHRRHSSAPTGLLTPLAHH